MNAMTVSRHVDAPPDRVWAVLTDLEHSPEVVRAIESVEIHTSTGFDVGTRWTETRTMMGRTASETRRSRQSTPAGPTSLRRTAAAPTTAASSI